MQTNFKYASVNKFKTDKTFDINLRYMLLIFVLSIFKWPTTIDSMFILEHGHHPCHYCYLADHI